MLKLCCIWHALLITILRHRVYARCLLSFLRPLAEYTSNSVTKSNLLLAALLVSSTTSLHAAVIDFETITTYPVGAFFPEGYAVFKWSGFFALNKNFDASI